MTGSLLIVAGLDPSAGAGLLADAEVARARGLHAAAVATALTVQDSAACHASHAVAPAIVAAQIALLIGDLDVRAVKIGMLGDAAVAAAVARALAPLLARGVPLVLDPVLRASVGATLLDGNAAAALAPLIAAAAVITPNRDEAERLTGVSVGDGEGQARAARALRAMGVKAALVKGGHLDGDVVRDLLDDGQEPSLVLASPRHPGTTPHGTGCALATEIACGLALGQPLREAVTTAHARVADRIVRARSAGKGRPLLGPPPRE